MNLFLLRVLLSVICFTSFVLAQSPFNRNDSYDFRGLHYLTAGGSSPDNFNLFIESNSDFRTIKLYIKKNRLNLGGSWNAFKYKVDMNSDGIIEQDWTTEEEKIISFTYPNPPDGISANHNINIQIRFSDGLGQTTDRSKFIPVTILSTPRVFYDSDNNTFIQLKNEDATNKIPVLMVEGFDPLNEKYQDLYYNLTWDLINMNLYPNNFEVFILNFNDGGRDLRLNAEVLIKAIEKIHEICSNYKIVLAGLSMGGPIGRYTLAKKESESGTHNVGLFLSYDSPQWWAHVSPDLQDWIKIQNPNEGAISELQANLQSVGAKQMLLYNTYDPSHILHNQFYNELNSLNGDGYPKQSYNVAVSNGNFNATWGYGSVGRHLMTMKINDNLVKDIPAVQLDCGAGSMITDITMKRYGDIFNNPLIHVWYELEIIFNPSYTPTYSALDLVNPSINSITGDIMSFERSKFHDYVVQTTPLQHHELSTVTRNKIMEWLNKNSTITVNYNLLEGGTTNSNNYQVKILHSKQVGVQSKNVNVNGKQIQYNFSNWEDGNSSNPRTFYSSHDVTYTAVMKGKMVSNTLSATLGNNQRKIYTDASNTYVVYESGGNIWFTRDDGTGWSPEVCLSSSTNAKNPSIVATYSGPVSVHVVWEEYEPAFGGNQIVYRRSTDRGENWENQIVLGDPLLYGAYGIEATPVVQGSTFPVVIWRYGDGAGYGGLALCSQPTVNNSIYIISGSNFTTKNPSLGYGRRLDGQEAFLLAYEQGPGYISYKEFNVSANPPYNIYYQSSPVLIAAGGVTNPSVTGTTNKTVFVVWDLNNGANHFVYSKERNSSGIWQAAEVFNHGSHHLSKPSVNITSNTVNVVWQCDNHIGLRTKTIGGSWSGIMDLGIGNNPNISAFSNGTYTTKTIWISQTSAPYSLDIKSIQYVSGTITGNTTWSGYYNIIGTVAVGSGATLNILPGTVMLFQNGSKIVVSGTGNLQANGNSNNRIIFDFVSKNSSTQNGIHLSTGTASIKYCDIKNAFRGINIIYTNPITVQHCNITYNSFGVYQAYGNSSGSIIDQNNISYNDYDGIYIQQSTPPQITKNVISNNGRHGIYSTSYTSTRVYNSNKIEYNMVDGIKCELGSLYLLPISGTGNNIIRGNINANIHAIYSGNIYANNSYTSIYWPELLNAYAENSSHIYADNNWWGSAPPYGFATNGGTIDYTPYLYSDPNAGLGKTSEEVAKDGLKIDYPSDTFFDTDLKNILTKMIEEKYEEAIPLYLQKLKVENNKEKRKYILQCLAECYQSTGKKDFKILLEREASTNLLGSNDLYASTIIELENIFLVQDEKYDKAIDNLNILKRDFSNNKAIDKHTTFSLWSLYFQKMRDFSKAEFFYNELKEKYADDDLTITAMVLKGEIDSVPRQRLKKESIVKEIPKAFALLGNYPNPFNPTTTITYTLPYKSSVDLVIYDIMGREVKSFNISSQSAGVQNILWDGTNENGIQVASGIYIYRIVLKSLENNEVFVKTAKLMMLK